MKRSNPLLTQLLGLLVAFLCSTQPAWSAQITARVSKEAVAPYQSFDLILEAKGDAGAPPDLSVLEPDFQIVGHRQSQSTRSVNGQMRRRLTLVLTLVPKRSGQLRIPPIRFGDDASGALSVQVAETAPDQGGGLPEAGPPGDERPPYPMWPGAESGMPGMGWPPFREAFPPPPAMPPPPGSYPSAPRQSVQPTTESSEAQLPRKSNPWVWVSLLLAVGWGITLAAWLVGRRNAGAAPAPTPAAPPPATAKPAPPPPPPPPKTDLELSIEAVKQAYLTQDREAAKQALLGCSRLIWEEPPPSNLSGIAERCPDNLKKGILALDRALYSPQPEPWYEQPVYDWLSQLSPQKGEGA